MQTPLPDDLVAECAGRRKTLGFVPLETLFSTRDGLEPADQVTARARRLARLFNAPLSSRTQIRAAIKLGNPEAENLDAWMRSQGIETAPCQPISASRAQRLEGLLRADPAGFLTQTEHLYPASAEQSHWGFDPAWITSLLARSAPRLARFIAERRSDLAVLVGNGPSLRHTDLSKLHNQDVFITNYAVQHPELASLARGVAVSNYFVADQAPEVFDTDRMWRVFPVWLSHVLGDSPDTIWLNALGGELFFSADPLTDIAWHATVSYFWMQVLYHAGYRTVLLIGFDNSYTQPKQMREGTLIHQDEADPNHFDPAYFRGKLWQAADTDHMAQTYALARQVYERDGRRIVNCTVGGELEVFPRSTLDTALA